MSQNSPKTKHPKSELKASDYEKLGRLMQEVVETGAANKFRLLSANFLRGIAYGLGVALGGTIVVGLVLYIINLFNDLPVIGELITKLKQYY